METHTCISPAVHVDNDLGLSGQLQLNDLADDQQDRSSLSNIPKIDNNRISHDIVMIVENCRIQEHYRTKNLTIMQHLMTATAANITLSSKSAKQLYH